MEIDRSEISYGDRTNFSFYDKLGQYQMQHPHASPLSCAYVDFMIQKNGRVFIIDSLTDSKNRDVSGLVDDSLPDYVVGPGPRIKTDEDYNNLRRRIGKFIETIESAHKHAEHSKLVFG